METTHPRHDGREQAGFEAGTENPTPTATRKQPSNSTASQRARIAHWLRTNRRMTTLQARQELGIMHPAARIQELRERGLDIRTGWHEEEDSTGVKHRQGVYVLISEKGSGGAQ